MERLLYSASPTPLKIHPQRNSSLSRFGRVDSAKLNFPNSSFSARPGFRRFNSISCKYGESPLSSSPSSFSSSTTTSDNLPSLCRSSQAGSPNGMPELHNVKQITIKASGKRKVTGIFIVLSALIMILIQPVLAPAAFATFETASKTGGHRLIQSEVISSAWAGFLAGCLHTLSGPDHLAALAPLSIGRTPMESAAVGALWGCGHDAGQVIFGLLFLLLKDKLQIEVFRTWGTRVVGMTLLVIGALGIREASVVPAPCIALENGECDVSMYEPLEKPTAGKKKVSFATFATGIVHGLQPDALMIILPALALPSRVAGAAFLGMFLVGTVVSMGSYTVFISSCSEALKERMPRITEKLTWAASFVAIALGLAILISQFFGYSLY